MTAEQLIQLVREYFAAKANLDDWGPARNLQVKGAARLKARVKAQRRFSIADIALRAAVGVDELGAIIKEPSP